MSIAFEVWFIKPAETAQNVPFALELSETFNQYADEQHKRGCVNLNILESIITPATKLLAKRGMTPHGIAHMLSLAGNGFKQDTDIDEFKKLIDTLISTGCYRMQIFSITRPEKK